MHRSVAFFAAVTLIMNSLVAAKAPTISGCDSSHFNLCTRRLAESIGEPLQYSNVWLDPIYFNDILEQKFIADDNNMDSVAKICNGLQIFYSCLGPYITSCISAEGLISVRQMDPLSAYAYIGYLNMWRFQCGAGFYALEKTSSLGCVQNTMKNNFKALNEAADSYRNNVEHDPSHACAHAKTLQDTFRAAYAGGKCKDENKDQLAGWWACEGQKEYTEAEYRECSHVNKCEYVRAGTPTNLIKFVNGKMLIKIGPTWKKTETGEWYQEPAKWV